MARTRLLFVITSLSIGGAEGQLIKLIQNLDREKFDPMVVLLAEGRPDRLALLGCDVRVLGIAPGGYSIKRTLVFSAMMGVGRLAAILRAFQPDVVHAFLPAASVIAGSAILLSRSKAFFIVGRRGLVNSYRSKRSYAALFDRLCTKYVADIAIGNSKEVTRELINVDGVEPARALTIYNGVEIPTRRAGSSSLPDFVPLSKAVICMVANFRKQKGHLDFVRIAVEIARAHPDCAFLLLGANQGTRIETEEALLRSGLTRWSILPEDVPPDVVYGSSTIYLCTSEAEGFSNVILEAMAAGLPVVASNVGGNAEAVLDGETGFIVPPRDVKLFVEKCALLISHPHLRSRMGQAGRARAAALFSVRAMVESYEGVYLKGCAYSAGRGSLGLRSYPRCVE
jgi:glycosyltransferase involved in cell wall biosynthesis